ncbi:MAG: NADH-quinone oxidoreductase subunit L [Betaproteobacteria bacterium]|nr:NADH-quinone oxidoreductase subunit L [Betaproteobacteria bacterium]MSQ88246.1 NADH-quinone oxidoreductase subunit L [Betaproteobacteria bacterium]
MKTLYLLVPLAPLVGAVLAGLFGKTLGRAWAHRLTILSVLISFICALIIFVDVLNGNSFNGSVYTWARSGGTSFEIGFLIDRLSALMMIVVTFVSLMVHVYTIGYMAQDPGYQRFFAYISLFTFSMLMLVMANNFLQLFFGWEAVGLVSYLLIGFWYTRPTAIYANLKAFLVNRVGDFGFLLGIGLILATFGTLDYAAVFSQASALQDLSLEIIPNHSWHLLTVICILLFIGAMGKSAQFPLHVWLPDSMEGPTPISALIHAATMVTAGIFMVARMSSLFELSETARSVVLVIGAITALAMGLVALTQFDLKRVVAYSTLSQLGYMTVALGASAYSAAMFHLMTHAFFKAVLFLAAGSVIIALHHEQDMRRMGGLKKFMPWTYWTLLIGAIASAGIPPLAGFYSKDAIIEAAQHSQTPGATFAYLCVLACVFVTAAYTFRLVFMAFHGEARFDPAHPPHESPAVVTAPLVLLAIPSIGAGWLIGYLVFGDFFLASLYREENTDYHGLLSYTLHGMTALPFWLALAGIATAWFLYLKKPQLPKKIAIAFGPLYALVERKYGFDELYTRVFALGAQRLGVGLWKGADERAIDGVMVNGSARLVLWFSAVVRLLQSGLLYWYAFMMIFGVCAIYALVKYRVFT